MSCVFRLCDNLAACPVVPVEVMRISLPSQTGKAKGKVSGS